MKMILVSFVFALALVGQATAQTSTSTSTSVPTRLETNVVTRTTSVWEEVTDVDTGKKVSIRRLGPNPNQTGVAVNGPQGTPTSFVGGKAPKPDKNSAPPVYTAHDSVTDYVAPKAVKEVFVYQQWTTNYYGDGPGQVQRRASGAVSYPGADVGRYTPAPDQVSVVGQQQAQPVAQQPSQGSGPTYYPQSSVAYYPTTVAYYPTAVSYYPSYGYNYGAGYYGGGGYNYSVGYYENRRLFGVNFTAAVNPVYSGGYYRGGGHHGGGSVQYYHNYGGGHRGGVQHYPTRR